MGITDQMWDAITTVIRTNDKVERMGAAMRDRHPAWRLLTSPHAPLRPRGGAGKAGIFARPRACQVLQICMLLGRQLPGAPIRTMLPGNRRCRPVL